MNAELIQEFAVVCQKLKDSEGFINADVFSKNVLVRKEVIQDEKELVLSNRGDSTYPYEISVTKDGVKVFSILKPEDIVLFPQFKEKAKSELLKQLHFLETDVDLSGMPEVHESA